jgi:transglutaminase-like putative cysteine protease
MSEQQWIRRYALTWLLVAQVAVIIPHSLRLPIWIDIVWLISAIWRVLVYQGRWSFPNRVVKTVLVIGCLAGIRYSYTAWTGLEPTVALLIICFSIKLLEAATRREALILLFLGYFVALTVFLFEQGLGTVLYMLLPVVLLTAALVALHQSAQHEPLRFSWQPLRSAAVMAAQAVPVMLLLFLVFPRIAPLWQVPLPSAGAHTGMSDEMAPGDIAELSLSDALAFRVAFSGAVPSVRDLYWRGLVLDKFDGRRWLSSTFNDMPLPQTPNAASGPALDYQVYLEPTYQRWLYALQRPVSVDAKTSLTIDYRLLAPDIIYEKMVYRARAYPQAPLDAELDTRLRKYELTLPAKGNPRAQAWAQQLRAQYSDDAALIDALLQYFRAQEFYYTLKPPLLGEQAIDEFLFDIRRGFCEHYASTFVFVLRAAGIPARVVVGYQGGEINPLTGTVLVHQFDAHAWAEAWLPERGWVRFDPTAAVAPQRIENGLERAVSSGEFLGQSPLSVNRYRTLGWLNALRLRTDAMNYAWTRWVVNYRDDTQTAVLRNLLGEISPLRIGLLLVGGGGAMLAIVALVLLGHQFFADRLPIEQIYYQRFCRRLAQRGFERPAGMAPGDYARWVLAQQPQWRFVREITDCFEMLSYRKLSLQQRRQLLLRLKRSIGRINLH